jgi:hypothetical protein
MTKRRAHSTPRGTYVANERKREQRRSALQLWFQQSGFPKKLTRFTLLLQDFPT